MAEKNPMAPCADTVLTDAELQALTDEAQVLDRLLLHWPVQLQESDIQKNSSWARTASSTATGSKERWNSCTGPGSHSAAARS